MSSQLQETDRRVLRKGAWLCVVGLIGAYAVAVPLKAAGAYPDYLTWIDVLVAPAAIFLNFWCLFVFPLWFPRHWGIPYATISLVSIAGCLFLTWWERGW